MTHRRLRSAQRFVSLLCVLFGAASLAAGCGGGNVGDGASDDGTAGPVLVSAGTSGGKAAPKSHAGASSQAGASAGGSAGLGGGAGSSGLGGNAAKAGAGGRAGSGGKGGAAGMMNSSGATGFAGASNSGGSAGSTSSGGSAGTDASAGTSGTSTSAGAAGMSGAAGSSLTCGDGVIQAGEQCDDKGPSPQCSNTCLKVSDTDCVTCENTATCIDFVNNCLGPENGTPFTADEQTQCYAVMACIISSKCFAVDGTLGGTCYCGSLSTSDCTAAPFDLTKPGAPNGPCAALIQAGMPGVTTNSAVIGGDLTKNTFPAGAAMQRLNCQKKADDAACAEACGYTVFPF